MKITNITTQINMALLSESKIKEIVEKICSYNTRLNLLNLQYIFINMEILLLNLHRHMDHYLRAVYTHKHLRYF